MAQFDPYHTWLGIPPDKQPPHCYRLLGLAAFEDNPTVIEEAADRQMAHVKRHEKGKHSDASQKLLNEISAAKVTLLNPDKKIQYDQKLKALAARRAAAKVDKNADKQEPQAGGPAFPNIATEPATPAERIKRTAQRPKWLVPAIAAGAVVSVAALIGLGALLMGGDQQPPADSDNNQTIAAAPSGENSNSPTPPAASSDNDNAAAADPAPVDAASNEPTNSPPANSPATNTLPANTVTPSHELPPVGETLHSTTTNSSENTTAATPTANAASPEQENAAPATPPDESQPRSLADLANAPSENERNLADLVEAPAKAQPPTADQLRAATATIDNLFQQDLAAARDPASQSALASKFLSEAESESFRAAPVGRYALLTKACDLASNAGDLDSAFRAIGMLDAGFEIDSLPLQIAALEAVAKSSRDANTRAALIERALDVVELAVGANQFAEAEALASLALSTATRLRNVELRKRAADVKKTVEDLARQAERFEQAQAALTSNPDDAAANLLVGKYWCLLHGDWEQGLPHLAKCGAEDWAAAAALDAQFSAAASSTLADSKQLADAWWEIAEKHRDQLEQAALRRRAAHWYRVAAGKASGIEKLALEKRIQEAEQAAADAGPTPGLQGAVSASGASPPIPAGAPAGLVKTFKGHEGGISSCRFSPDQRQVVSTSKDGTTRVWDIATEKEIFSSPHNANFAAFLSANHVYSVGYDDRVVVWDLRTRQPVQQHSYSGAWNGARADNSQKAPVFAYSTCWELALVHVEQGREIKFPKPEHAAITAVSLSRDGEAVITGDREGGVRLWSVPQMREVKKLADLSGEVHGVALSPNKRLAVVGHWNNPQQVIAVFDTQSGEQLRTENLTWVDSLEFSPDGRRYAASGRNSITVWETDSGQRLQNFSVPEIWNRVVRFSADGAFLLTGSDDNLVRLWKIDAE